MGFDKFAAGHWQKEMPTVPGRYPTATRDGRRGPEIVIYSTAEGSIQAFEEWEGWWWSEAIPNLPKPGKWED